MQSPVRSVLRGLNVQNRKGLLSSGFRHRCYSSAIQVKDDQGKLAQIIRDSIKATGPIPVSRYMQYCLSHPTHGYYKKGEVFGKQGDFITSPEISQIFGELVAIWFLTRYMALKEKRRKIRLLELGPGRGTLMADLLRTLFSFDGVKDQVEEVVLVENSPNMRKMQEELLSKAIIGTSVRLKWVDHIEEVETNDSFNMLVAHEFFDAMPINVFEKRENGYREVLVDTDPSYTPNLSTAKTSGLRFVISPEATPLSTVLPATSPRFAKLPVGSRIEISQESYKIMRKVGQLIGEGDSGGAGLIVDYGGDRHFGSSFRAFRRHKIVDVFDEPGSSDLTANVDFAYLKESISDNARPLGPIDQSQFLVALGLQPRLNKLLSSASSDERRADLQHGAERLIDNLGMGSQYQVMGVVPKSAEEVYPFIDTKSSVLKP